MRTCVLEILRDSSKSAQQSDVMRNVVDACRLGAADVNAKSDSGGKIKQCSLSCSNGVYFLNKQVWAVVFHPENIPIISYKVNLVFN